ncbi:hypothetical protein HS7_01670 [Sulfolobales archaeon HS-7]|nr:hypothetical protein HS7_01670 [Sulfolobales archaeon HS-7]
MASHYLTFSAGITLSFYYIKLNKYIGLIGVVPAIVFHLPYFFCLSAAHSSWTYTDFTLMFMGGLLLGSSIRDFSNSMRISLFILYMIGDTLLAVLFVIGSPLYSSQVIPFSPYSPGQFLDTGILMFGVMNTILAYILIYFFRKLAI